MRGEPIRAKAVPQGGNGAYDAPDASSVAGPPYYEGHMPETCCRHVCGSYPADKVVPRERERERDVANKHTPRLGGVVAAAVQSRRQIRFVPESWFPLFDNCTGWRRRVNV